MTHLINTLSITASVTAWLANSKPARILHLFEHACNLINEQSEILSIVTPEIGNGPFNLVVEGDIDFREHLSPASQVAHTATQLQIGELTIRSQNATLWDPCIDWNALHAARDAIVLQVNGFLKPQSPVSHSLALSVAKVDVQSCKKSAQNLAGLGPGLTPCGDDFMMGAMYAAWIIHPRDVAEILASEIANTAAPLTTSLSGAWLRAAAKGEAGILWHRFLDALISGDPSAIELEKSNILSIGATSGADALAGFIHTFIAFLENEKKHALS